MKTLKSPTRFHSAESRKQKKPTKEAESWQNWTLYTLKAQFKLPQPKNSLQGLNAPTRKSRKHKESKRQGKDKGIRKNHALTSGTKHQEKSTFNVIFIFLLSNFSLSRRRWNPKSRALQRLNAFNGQCANQWKKWVTSFLGMSGMRDLPVGPNDDRLLFSFWLVLNWFRRIWVCLRGRSVKHWRNRSRCSICS